MKKLILISSSLLGLASITCAQNLTSRTSHQNYNYVFGAGGDANSDSYSETDGTLVSTDTMTNGYSGSTSGTLPGGNPYTAGVAISLDQEFTVTGPLSSFSNIYATSTSVATTAVSGAGLAQVLTTNPGNEIVFEFSVGSDIDYHLFGNLTVSPSEAGIANFVTLQKFDGIVWQNVFTTLFLPNSQGAFDVSGVLTNGNYRLRSANGLTGFGSDTVSSTYDYNFEAVPEPMTFIALLPAVAFLRRKRK